MARPQLNELRTEIQKYLGLPYFINQGKFKNHGPDVSVGKGTAEEIALKTIEFANLEKVDLLKLSSRQIYNFQKKHHLGIDCSGLACHLLNFYYGTNLIARKTSANTLTSKPVSQKIKISQVETGDLVRQEGGKHVLFVVSKNDVMLEVVDSNRLRRGVTLRLINLKDKSFKYNGFYRFISPPTTITTNPIT